jgi:hypothetical protein
MTREVQRQSSRWFWAGASSIAILIGFFLLAGVESLNVTDAQIESGAPEDTLGLGVLPIVLFAAIGAVATLWLWLHAQGIQRRIASMEAVILGVSVVFSIWAYNILRAQVLK